MGPHVIGWLRRRSFEDVMEAALVIVFVCALIVGGNQACSLHITIDSHDTPTTAPAP